MRLQFFPAHCRIESAILGCAVFTAYGALRHDAEMCAGDSVAVIGVGGVRSRLADTHAPRILMFPIHISPFSVDYDKTEKKNYDHTGPAQLI
jgi:D-arabinose 1-dehydrogenase-like Zn-dependent alcohol dehydrogenase